MGRWVAILGARVSGIATRNSGVQTSTKKLDIRPSLYSEVPPLKSPTCSSILPPSEFEAGLQPSLSESGLWLKGSAGRREG